MKRRGWLRVAWEGYHPSWEAWRKEGEPGVPPVITWEPRRKVKKTEAYEQWEAAQSEEESPALLPEQQTAQA